jgi:SAM-dependent methyltransferase
MEGRAEQETAIAVKGGLRPPRKFSISSAGTSPELGEFSAAGGSVDSGFGAEKSTMTTAITLDPALPDCAYAAKAERYFVGARADFVARLPTNPAARVLEIGCGSGETGALALGAGKAGHYTGIELFEAAAHKARARLSDVIVGNAESLPLDFPKASFDGLILSEVLEHLIEPGRLLARLAPALKPGAMVLASSPNVSHWRVVREVIAGRFDLADQGVFDRTHMRWFTPSTYRALFEAAGYDVVATWPLTPFAARTRLLSRVTGGRLDHLFMAQICLEARRR